MSEVRPVQVECGPRGVFRAALLCAGAAVFCLPGIALAQQTGSLLRGQIDEATVKQDLLGKDEPIDSQTTGATQDNQDTSIPPYQPVSEGATPDPDKQTDADRAADAPATTPRSIFSDDRGDDASGDGTTTTPATRLSTAQARAEARKKANQPAASTAERLAAERKKGKTSDAREGGPEEPDTVDTTGTVRAKTIDSETELKVKREQEREESIEGLDKVPDANPYAALGIRLGTFIVSPSLESGLTWTSNADSSPTGEPALLSETTLRLNAISEFGGDRTTIDAFGNYRKTISGDEIEETRAGVDAALERDLGHEWRVLATLGYEVGPESASSPAFITEDTLEEPIEQTFDASLGLEKQVGKIKLRLTGNVEREDFGDAELSGGGSVSQSDRNNTLGTVVLRTGYEVSPALAPFIELEYGGRDYDEDLDSAGFARSSTRTGARGGAEVDLGEKFKGEFSAGWIEEDLEDDRLEPISGPTIAAALLWSPIRGTNVNLDASTIVEGATSPGESGSILHSGFVTISHELRANLTANLGFGLGLRDYTGIDGRDTLWIAESGMTYWFNRYVGLTGKFHHEQQSSTLPDRDYKTNSVFLGLKLQR